MAPFDRTSTPSEQENSPEMKRDPEAKLGVVDDTDELANTVHRLTEEAMTPAAEVNETNETVELIDIGITFNPSAYDAKSDYWEMDIVLVIDDEEFHLVIPNSAMKDIQDELDADFPLGFKMDETWWREFYGNRGEQIYGALWNLQKNAEGRIVLPEVLRPFLR